MRRPMSAKPGAKVSDQESYDSKDYEVNRQQIKTESQKMKNRMLSATQQRKFMNIAKPVELSNGQFTRIMPKNIYQDKERLYSEALQLRQNMHGVLDQNTKLKTKIAKLEREKDQLTKLCDQDVGKHYSSGAGLNHQTTMVSKLKKLLRDSQQHGRVLQAQTKKLKKAVKYTKISQLEIENRTLIEQTIKLNQYIDELVQNQQAFQDEQNRMNELQTLVVAKKEQNQKLINTNKAYSEQLLQLQEESKLSQMRSAQKEKKLVKDLDIARRRLDDSRRENEYLQAQVSKLREEKLLASKPQAAIQFNSKRGKTATNNAAPSTQTHQSVGGPPRTEPLTQPNQQEVAKLNKIIEQLKKNNKQLQSRVMQLSKIEQAAVVEKSSPTKQKPLRVETKQSKKVETDQKQQNSQLQKGAAPLDPPPIFKPQPGVVTNKRSSAMDDYAEEFQTEQKQKGESPKLAEAKPKSPTKAKQPTDHSSVKFEEYKEDFADEDSKNDEQVLYKKQQKKEKKEKKQKSPSDKKKKTGKSGSKSANNKKELSPISELLTYRMRGQRYPFDQLRQDIIDSGELRFQSQQLMSMLQNSPFFLNDPQTQAVLKYFFDGQPFTEQSVLSIEKLIEKLRKLIKDVQPLEQQEEQQMDLRIVQMVTTYANQLQAAFQQKKNGDGTISKADLQSLFQQLQLQKAYVQLIIGRLSLMSEDMEHLNYFQFFNEFYDGDDMQVRQVDEQYDNGDSRTLNRQQNMIQQEQMQQSEESKRSKRRIDDRKKPKRGNYEME